MNFVDINQEITTPTINLNKIAIEQEPTQEGCIQAECPVTMECSTEYFAIKNLFSELTDDYQRAIIRQNLGINGADALLWGKIEGNLVNQKDLYNFIIDTLKGDEKGILDQVNLELKYWSQHIENKIESLASNIKVLDIIPRYATSNQIPVDILVTWEYDQPVEAQAINGVSLDPDVRSYIFQNIEDSFAIRLSYYFNGVWLSRNNDFSIVFPTFYGTSPNWEDDRYTIQDNVEVTANEGEYIYVITKNPSELSVNGIIGGFEQDSVIYIQSIRYYVYKSVQPNLGLTKVRIYDTE